MHDGGDGGGRGLGCGGGVLVGSDGDGASEKSRKELYNKINTIEIAVSATATDTSRDFVA